MASGSKSGYKDRVMISCVTFETEKVASPAEFYDSTVVHLIHYVKGTDERAQIYTEFYDRVCGMIKSRLPNVRIVEHVANVSDFTAMLRTVLSIIKAEKASDGECDIYVNISAGSSEYAAAATIASMMSPGTIPFSVNASKYTIGTVDEIKSAYYRDGEPVGLASEVRNPRMLPYYSIGMPKEHLVRALRILDTRNREKRPVASGSMAEALREQGVWFREAKAGDGSARRQSDAVNYHRDFVTPWQELGWIEKDELRRRYVVTEKGRNVLDTFFVDDADRSETGPDDLGTVRW